MTKEQEDHGDPRIAQAITELETLVSARYPTASFAVSAGEDPEGTYLTATVDVEDTDEVTDVVIDRLVALQVEEGVPVYFQPVRPMERQVAMRQSHPHVSDNAAILSHLQGQRPGLQK